MILFYNKPTGLKAYRMILVKLLPLKEERAFIFTLNLMTILLCFKVLSLFLISVVRKKSCSSGPKINCRNVIQVVSRCVHTYIDMWVYVYF